MNDNQNVTTDQPLVTHEDRGTIELLALCAKAADLTSEERGRVDEFLKRNRDAAEADKPALPEGWVLIGGWPRWHDGAGGIAFNPGGALVGRVVDYSDTIAPLVTAASLVPEGWRVEDGEKPDHDGLDVIVDASGSAVMFRCDAEATFERDDVFDVLAALVTAAQAERGETR